MCPELKMAATLNSPDGSGQGFSNSAFCVAEWPTREAQILGLDSVSVSLIFEFLKHMEHLVFNYP